MTTVYKCNDCNQEFDKSVIHEHIYGELINGSMGSYRTEDTSEVVDYIYHEPVYKTISVFIPGPTIKYEWDECSGCVAKKMRLLCK